MTAPALLELSDVARHFGGVHAVSGLSLHVRPGEIVGLIGPNGAGKTTAFNVVNGILRPTRGSIRFDGREIGGLKPNRIVRMGLARTFQHTNVFARATVRENVMRGMHLRAGVGFFSGLFNFPKARAAEAASRSKADELLELLGLSPNAETLAGALSYGNQRRLGVAIALATSPRLLMLDEPVAGLNPEESMAFGTLIRRVVASRGIAVLLVEHHMRLVMALCDRIAVLEYGKKISEGTPAEIQADPLVIAAYLGVAEADDVDA